LPALAPARPVSASISSTRPVSRPYSPARRPFDHVVVTAAKTKVAAIRELPLTDAYQSMNSKFWGAYRIARSAKIAAGGSLTFVSGFLSIRPQKGAAIQSAINAALEGLTRGLALELAPVGGQLRLAGPDHDRDV